MLLLAFFAIASMGDWVPARWHSADPKSLELLRDTPVNCLLLESKDVSASFVQAATRNGVAVLAVVRPAANALDTARKAASLGANAVVLEGEFDSKVRNSLTDSKVPVIELGLRSSMRLDSADPILGTDQGIWPGIQIEESGASKSAPSGGPWIDTNTGFLRFVRAYSPAAIWIANQPPANTVISLERYVQVIGDAAMSGARWVVSLDPDFEMRLLRREPRALADWKRLATHLRFYEQHGDWRTLQPHTQFALIEDVGSGALLSGGVLDMIAVKHTPVRPVPDAKLDARALKGAELAVDVDPKLLTEPQKLVLKSFTRGGGTLLSGPSSWQFPTPAPGQITLNKDDLKKLDEIWKEVNSMTGRRNLGARLFNVSTMLSNLLESPGADTVVLNLVNYSDYPVDSVTVHLLGDFKRARLLIPEGKEQELAVYKVDEGTGIDIEKISTVAAVVLSRN